MRAKTVGTYFWVLLLICCAYLSPLAAQHTISGHFTPPEDFKWIIAYELTPTSQRYVDDTAVNEGKFTLSIPDNAVPGTYRLVYGIPQDIYFIDILYNGKEDIAFDFSWEDGVSFTFSKENRVYKEYQLAMAGIEDQIIEFYNANNTDADFFLKMIKTQDSIQNTFETASKGLLAASFIKANRPYIPQSYQPFPAYLQHKKDHFFDHIPIENTMLQASSFLTDKVTAYTFSALSPELKTATEVNQAIKENMDIVQAQLKKVPHELSTQIYYQLWQVAQSSGLFDVADHVFNTYLSKMALTSGNEALIDEITTATRLRLGSPAPEIVWENNGTKKSLSELSGADTYLLIFWSSTCSHCLQELPLLYGVLQRYPQVKVVAIGLEDSFENWQRTIAQFPTFEHTMSLDKWESSYAKTYAIQKTPTYFVLDREKKIKAKPESYEELLVFLKEMGKH
jgi:thiol-disulfide isomerase/thioredoxin